MELGDVPDLSPAAFDVHRMIESVTDRFRPLAQGKGLSLEVKTSASVPRNALGEEEWIREVMLCLIDNAVRFTDVGEVVASITADSTSGARVLFHLEVSDTGRGIAPEELARLFAPRRPRFAARAALGAGGRLAVARRLVELMDGRIGCSSVVGLGTTSWFTVPLDVA